MDAYYLYGMGLEQYEQGNYSKAIEYFEQSNVIEEHFKTMKGFLNAGRNWEKQKKRTAALK
ncbi:MAG: tetratricopeptide repeat protein [Lachnospiraceae bacterium]|nr:tetratricopeptide repeat protein [Lachnospiraceae bacterium]